jgi:uncharacterized protein (TIGR02687 family)
MKVAQVDEALIKKFVTDGVRLVFWHDPDGEFSDYIASGLPEALGDVQLLEADKVGGLSAKLRLEREDPEGRYLIYSTGAPVPPEQDWLLDIRLYSAQFHADIASVWLQELGLTRLSLRDHLRARVVFLGSRERRRRLARLVSTDDDAAALDLKMMAVLVGSGVANPFPVLRALCHGHVQDDRFELGRPPQVIATFEKMGLADRFWALMKGEFGYSHAPASVADLLRRLFVSELLHQVSPAQIKAFNHFELPDAGKRNAVVFLTQWRDSSGSASSYDAAAASVAADLDVQDHLSSLPETSLENVFTFWQAEKLVASSLKARVHRDMTADEVEAVARLTDGRMAGHWLSGPGRDRPEARAIAHAYQAFTAAARLFERHRQASVAISAERPAELLDAYVHDLHLVDRLYRAFMSHASPSGGLSGDILKSLAEEVEALYEEGFLRPLGQAWSRLLDEGFLGEWRHPAWTSQQRFYEDTIKPHLEVSDRKRAFVIISDAFRYEAAAELTELLNGRYRMTAELGPMLGVLPSVTQLGMASLLPRKKMSFSDSGEVWVDGQAVTSTEARDKQLATVQGMACQAKDLLKMKVDEARETTRGKRVVYVYHDVIDHALDGDARETGRFDVIDLCIAEVAQLVQFCVNKLSASKVWVTADHGFLFQDAAPDETDKSKLSYKPERVIKSKKRYVLGRDLGQAPEAHHGSTKITAGAEGDVEFWVPRGANRFHFMGGSRFVHGGAMPQEIVLPLVTIHRLRGKDKKDSRVGKVSVQVLGSKHKITAPVHRFELIQLEAVGERRKPVTLRIAVYEGTEPVTSVETVHFTSASDRMEDRKKSIRLELRKGSYDKAKPYRLVLRDAESDAEVQSMAVVIDRSFQDDF